MIKSTREGLLLCLAFTTGAALMAGIAGLPWPIPASSALAAVILFLMVLREPAEPEQLDVWAMQRRIMAASDQPLPETPTLSHGLLLYIALTAEELAETLDASLRVIMSRPLMMTTDQDLIGLANEMQSARDDMQVAATRMRHRLARIAPDAINWPLTGDSAIAVFDGVSDVVVTTAGMAEAAGLPGKAGYVEVQLSNWSKTNPLTGKIDKDPSGKWIKGVNYRQPNMAAVLDSHIAGALLKRLADQENPGYYTGQ